ncbi:MAG: COQ9 family protein [Pseudomonadota bacterium]|nr:COQ9 family protein [Pseudomonadota bacterium]
MTEETLAERDALIGAALHHIPFDGWSATALNNAASDLGWDKECVAREFPLGIVDAIRHFSQQVDRYMVHSIEEEDLTKMRMHERVGLAVETRLNFLEPHKEAVHRGMTWLAMPQNSMLGARLLYQTVDDIWYAVGDRSADFSFYTKRGLLAGVVGTTLLFWLDDRSEECSDTREFLSRRISDVMKIHATRKRFEHTCDRVLSPLNVITGVIKKRYVQPLAGKSRVT